MNFENKSVKGVSVIVCTYNGYNRITDTLQHLLLQKVEEDIFWEIIVVDNNSSDSSLQLINKFLSGAKSFVDYRVFTEPKEGKTNALLKGVNEARYSYLIICDDDNWLNEKYVSIVYKLFENSDKAIGIIGGCGIPEFEDKSTDLEKVTVAAVGAQYPFPGIVKEKCFSFYGAGSAIKKEVFQQIEAKKLKILIEKTSGGKAAGEDTEICYLARVLGFRLLYSDQLTFKHFMPKNRFLEDPLYRGEKSHASTLFTLRFYQIQFDLSNNRYLLLLIYPFFEFYTGLKHYIDNFNKNKAMKVRGKMRMLMATKNAPQYYFQFWYYVRLFFMIRAVN